MKVTGHQNMPDGKHITRKAYNPYAYLFAWDARREYIKHYMQHHIMKHTTEEE